MRDRDALAEARQEKRVLTNTRRAVGIERAKMDVVINPSEGKPSMGESNENLKSVTQVGVDLAKKALPSGRHEVRGAMMAPQERHIKLPNRLRRKQPCRRAVYSSSAPPRRRCARPTPTVRGTGLTLARS
jgi:hypothetical protein